MKKILVIEDDKFLDKIYQIKLKEAGFDAQIATDGQQALDVLKKFVPDLIIMDLILPVKDGFEALQEIRANGQFKSTPILVVSNLSQKEDIDKVKSLGVSDFIIKTDITLSQLIEKIKSLTS